MADRPAADVSQLRTRAESLLNGIIVKSAPNLSPENVQSLVHELRVHQIELEMQCQELQRAQQEVEESRDTYRELYESIPVGFVTIDRVGHMYDLNPAGTVLLGLELGMPVRTNINIFFVGENADRFTLFTREVMSSKVPGTCELTVERSDGTRFIAALQGAPVRSGEGKGERLRIAFDNVTARKTAEAAVREHQAELEASRTELQVLTERLFTAQEDERKRIACDLHDDHCQRLTALILEARSLVKVSEAATPSLAARIESMIRTLRGMLNDFRHLSHELYPRQLECLSLGSSMHRHIEEFADYAGLPIAFHERDVPVDLPKPVATCLYRLLQESLGNVHKHAKAQHITVTLTGMTDQVELMVSDDGRGFELESVLDKRNGMGLMSMQERIRPLQGRISIDSGAGRGTSIAIRIPLPSRA